MSGIAQCVALIAWAILLLGPTMGAFSLLLVTPLMLLWPQRLHPLNRASLIVAAFLPVLIAYLNWGLKLPDWVIDSAAAFRSELGRVNLGLGKDSAALVFGLTVGDDSQLSKSLVSGMQNLSLTHLTAVSGTNCTIVVIAAMALFGAAGLARPLRLGAAILALISYLWLVGPQPSVLRAGLMAMVVLLSALNGTRFVPRDVLAVAVLIALMAWPEMANSIGFALSAIATLAVLECAPRLAKKFQVWAPNWLALSLAVVISAQVACLPLLVTLQGQFSGLGILANLLAEPVVPAITLLGVLGVVVFPFAPWLSQGIFWIASFPAAYLVSLVSWLDGVDWNVSEVPVWVAFAFSVLLLLAFVLWLFETRLKRFAAPIAFSLCLVLLIGLVSPQLSRAKGFPADWSYVSCDVGQGDATLIRNAGKSALIDVGPDAKPTNRCLKLAGVNRISLLVLTHFDLDHIGGLSGVLREHEVDAVLMPNFKDDRPGADVALQLLREYGLQPKRVSLGDRGQLGSVSWTVLNPPRSGVYLEDANDASIVMRWDFAKYTALTMADTGESAQMRISAIRAQWYGSELRRKPLVLKVSHHGSADQYPELIEWLRPQLATVSVGAANSYGHPTKRTLRTLRVSGSKTLRTDELGSIAVDVDERGVLNWSATGG